MADREGAAQSGKTEAFLRMATPPDRGSHAQSSGNGFSTGLYRVPRGGLDLCPSCGTGTLQPVGATHDDVHFVCRDNNCGQKVARRKGMSLEDFMEG